MHAEGEYIAFLDDDDLRLPGSLDLQAQMDAHPEIGFVCGGMVMADQNYRPTGEIVCPKISGDIFFSLMELLFSEQRAELFSMIRSAMSGGTPDSPSRG